MYFIMRIIDASQTDNPVLSRAVMGTHFATWVPAYQYPPGTRVPIY